MNSPLMDVPWHELQHAYGEASDVPGWLTGIQSLDEDTRQEAWAHMFGSVVHQGTLYSSTPHVIPHLLHLLHDTTIPDRREIIWFFAVVAQGESDPPEYGTQVREQLTRALPEFRQVMLHDPDPVVRRNLPKVLVELPQQTGFALQVLHDALSQDPDPGVKAICLSATLELLLKWESETLPDEVQPILDRLPEFHHAQDNAALRLVSRLLTLRFVDRKTGLLGQLLEDFQEGCTQFEGWDEGGMEYFTHKTLEDDPELIQVWFQLMMQNPSAGVRVKALQNMNHHLDGHRHVENEACQMVAAGLKDQDAEVRFWASVLARGMGPLVEPLRDLLHEALEDEEVRVRCNALLSLGHLKDPQLRPHLVRFALSLNWWEINTAVDVMDLVGGAYPEVAEHFTGLLKRTDDELSACIMDVGEWQEAKDIRYSLIRGLGHATPTFPADVPVVYEKDYRNLTLSVLQKMGDVTEAAVDRLTEHLLDQPHRLLRQLQELQLSTPTVLAALKRLLGHEKLEVRMQAAAAWWKHTGDRDTAQELLLPFLMDMLETPGWEWTETLTQAVRALHEMKALPPERLNGWAKPEVSGWYWHGDLLETLWEVTRDGTWLQEAVLEALRYQNSYPVALKILNEMPDLTLFRGALETLRDQPGRTIRGNSTEVVWHDENLRTQLDLLLSQRRHP